MHRPNNHATPRPNQNAKRHTRQRGGSSLESDERKNNHENKHLQFSHRKRAKTSDDDEETKMNYTEEHTKLISELRTRLRKFYGVKGEFKRYG
jgi:Skp family chaperone for outer membrane proteins